MKKDADQNKPRIRVGLISLGCAKNLVDAEIMLGSLLKDGVEVTNDAAEADVVIVNTCSFIDSAQEESVDAILQSAELREAKNRGQGLVVSGCLPQRFREELPKLLPEVDAFMGIDQVGQVTDIVKSALERRRTRTEEHSTLNIRRSTSNNKKEIVGRIAESGANRAATSHEQAENIRGTDKFGKTKKLLTTSASLVDIAPRPVYIPDYATPRFRLTPRHFAYVKIAEGCNHPCSFCTIPQMRGSHRSRPQADIVQEARQLIADGVKELNLISQDSTFYGLDLRENRRGSISSPENFKSAAKALPADATTLCTLLRELNELPSDFWVRLLYTHPAHWTDELIRTIAECPKVARYVDMPLQHIHDNMLERMRRETSRQYIVDLIAKIRAGIPGIALRTTFIVGFPGETDEYFETLLEFIRETRFERMGVFTYSQEASTRAGRMEGQIPDRVKKQRRKLAMAEQHRVARAVSESFVGRTLEVLVEGVADVKRLERANIRSWEHGFVREHDTVKISGRKSQTGNMMVARGEADAPDIDGRVYIRGEVPAGEFAQIKIVGHTDYDLIAEAK